MIYIIGDSHVSVFSGTDKGLNGLRHIQPEFGTCYTLSGGSLRPHNVFEQRIPYFCPIKIGSNTAYNSFDKLPVIEQVIEEYEISEKDYIFLCFGEIDIRNHIGFNAEAEDILITEGIYRCVDRYMKTVDYLNDKYSNVGVYGSPPSSRKGDSPVKEYKDEIFRNVMTKEFNKHLKYNCNKNDIIFKDISEKLMLENGRTDPKFIMDDIHLSQEVMPFLKEEFKDLIDE
jgi:hypothetical protein